LDERPVRRSGAQAQRARYKRSRRNDDVLEAQPWQLGKRSELARILERMADPSFLSDEELWALRYKLAP
jgi:hypothetical protein